MDLCGHKAEGGPMIVDLTEPERVNSPCDGCLMATSSVSEWVDPKTGHRMQETTNCRDNCERYRAWRNREKA